MEVIECQDRFDDRLIEIPLTFEMDFAVFCEEAAFKALERFFLLSYVLEIIHDEM